MATRWVDGIFFIEDVICIIPSSEKDAVRIIGHLTTQKRNFAVMYQEDFGIMVESHTDLDHIRRKLPGVRFSIEVP